MKPFLLLISVVSFAGLCQMAAARTFECQILARCEGRILSTGCVAITPEAVRFDWQDEESMADMVLRSGSTNRVKVIETRREIVFVQSQPDAPFDTMSYALNKHDLTMMVVPDWEKPGYHGAPNWTGQCGEAAQISGLTRGSDRENG